MSKYPRHWFPWYQIVWNCIWIAPLLLTSLLFCLVVLMKCGPRDARRAWEAL